MTPKLVRYFNVLRSTKIIIYFDFAQTLLTFTFTSIVFNLYPVFIILNHTNFIMNDVPSKDANFAIVKWDEPCERMLVTFTPLGV